MVKKFFSHLFQSVMKHNIGTQASAISFFWFSALIPVCLLLIVGATLLIPRTAVETFLEGVLRSYVPAIPTGETFVGATVIRLIKFSTTIGIIGVVGLLWTSVGGFVSLQQILDTILEIHQRRSFWIQYVIGFAMLGILLVLTVVSSAITSLTPDLISRVTGSDGVPLLRLIHLIARLVFPLILFITCYVAYRVLPSYKLSNVALLVGAAFATLSIYVCRGLFVVYTHHLGNYELIFGTLTFVMLLIFWIYILSIIFLLGAEIAATTHKIKTELGGRSPV